MIEPIDNTPVEPPRVVRVYKSIGHALQEDQRNKKDAFASMIGTKKIRHQQKLDFEAKTWASSVLDSKPQGNGENADA